MYILRKRMKMSSVIILKALEKNKLTEISTYISSGNEEKP